ncbi:MAG: type I restriction enzyme HsdR N-terminal domain-containing protein [Muribaculaceae bacterium]|nr:type I restriction enzyme HsdR N-terminal domain-containing protein [Muribaculaceae bacterium]
MQRLNLPEYQFNIKKKENTCLIFDSLRRRWVTLTPEEWVRQNFVQFLTTEREFPAALMNNEISLTQNGIKRRCDTLVADRTGAPLAIIEYKAPTVEITQKTFDQIVRYNMVLKARFLIVSNGIKHYCCKIDYENNSYSFINDIPSYSQLL